MTVAHIFFCGSPLFPAFNSFNNFYCQYPQLLAAVECFYQLWAALTFLTAIDSRALSTIELRSATVKIGRLTPSQRLDRCDAEAPRSSMNCCPHHHQHHQNRFTWLFHQLRDASKDLCLGNCLLYQSAYDAFNDRSKSLQPSLSISWSSSSNAAVKAFQGVWRPPPVINWEHNGFVPPCRTTFLLLLLLLSTPFPFSNKY